MITHSELVEKLAKPGVDILKELTPEDCELWHMASCICSEAGELFDAIKRPVIYRKPLDRANVVEELGDLEFYMEGLRQVLAITRQETLDANILKLSKRYNELRYSNKSAAERADKSCSKHGVDWNSNCDECEGKAPESARIQKVDKTVTQIRKVAVVHYLRAGRAPCGIQGVPKVWPAGHLWSAYWDEVDCPDCLKHKLEGSWDKAKPGTDKTVTQIYKVDKSPSRRTSLRASGAVVRPEGNDDEAE